MAFYLLSPAPGIWRMVHKEPAVAMGDTYLRGLMHESRWISKYSMKLIKIGYVMIIKTIYIYDLIYYIYIMYTYAHHMIASSGCAICSTSKRLIMLIPGSETIRTICRKVSGSWRISRAIQIYIWLVVWNMNFIFLYIHIYIYTYIYIHIYWD